MTILAGMKNRMERFHDAQRLFVPAVLAKNSVANNQCPAVEPSDNLAVTMQLDKGHRLWIDCFCE